MFIFKVEPKDDHAILYYSSELGQYDDENEAVFMTTYEVLDALKMKGLVFALRSITTESGKRHLTLKEQAVRLLESSKTSLPRLACAEMISNIQIMDGSCVGFIEIPTETAFALIDRVDAEQ